jgi:tetratricopeptide (TPR) repeat protein
MRAGRAQEAFDVAEQGWQRLLSAPVVSTSVHRLATARAYLLIGRHRCAEARDTVRRARAIEGDNPDFAFFEGYSFESEAMETREVARSRELLEAAREAYLRCLGFGDVVFAQSFVVGARGCYGATRLGTVELLLGNALTARRVFDEALARWPTDRAARLGRAEAVLESGDAASALAELEPLLDRAPDGWTLAASAARALGREDDARLFADRARSLMSSGFVAVHRAARLRLEAASLAAKVA